MSYKILEPFSKMFVYNTSNQWRIQGGLGGYTPLPLKMFSVCILSIDYNKNTQNSKKM
jgi:hypothetical protein